jgi:hypothetical protein
MRPDVHAAALRSAAKLVLGMASLASITTACSSEATDDTGASTDAVMTKDNNDSKKTDDTMLSFGNGTGEATTAACKATLESAFPHPTFKDYGKATPQPGDVLDCCKQELAKHGSMTKYRWECCFAYDENAKVDPGKDGEVDPWDVPTLSSQAGGFACTPWGPPVPPQMNRMQRRNKKLSPARRDMVRFLVSQIEAQLAQVA